MIQLVERLFSEGQPYLFIYCLLFVLALLESCKEYKAYVKSFSLCTAILLATFTGLRWETGTDWPSYFGLFDNLELNWLFVTSIYDFDLGYVLFNALVKSFSSSYTVFLLIDSFIAVGMVYMVIRKLSPYPNLSLFIFYNAFFVFHFMGSNRRIIALAACLIAYTSILPNKKKKFFGFLTLAFLFHRTSITTLSSWLIPRKRLKTSHLLYLLAACFLIGLPQLPFKLMAVVADGLSFIVGQQSPLMGKLLFYSDAEHNQEAISEHTNPAIVMTLSMIKRSVFLTFFLAVIRLNRGVLDQTTDFFFNIYIVGFGMYMLFNGSPIFQILSSYFTFIEIILIGRMWAYTNANIKYYLLPILFLYGFFQLLNALSAYPDLYLPYKTSFM